MLIPLLFTALLQPPQTPVAVSLPLSASQLASLQNPPQGTAREALIRQLELALQLKTQGEFLNHGFLVSLSANLDHHPDHELAILMGRHERESHLLVLNAQGRILAYVPLNNWYGDNELLLASIGPQDKALVVRQTEEQGTGIYRDSTHFYQLIQGQLKGVLRLPGRAHLSGGGQLNQQLNVRWQALTGGENTIRATYQYRFLASPGQLKEDLDDWLWLEGEATVDYLWDNQQHSYQPDFYPQHPLNPTKLRSLEDLGNQEAFFSSFKTELQARWQKASPLDRKRMQTLGWHP